MSNEIETITGITEVADYRGEAKDSFLGSTSYYNQGYEGYRIDTTHGHYVVGVSNDQSCCESWGYICSEDDPAKFVGAQLLGIEVTDTNRTGREIGSFNYSTREDDAIELDSGEAMFVDIKTDQGTFQMAVYNCHNGYYGHTATIIKAPKPRIVYSTRV